MGRDLAFLRDALRRTLIAGDRVTGVTVLSAGHSNETYLVEGLDQVLRLPPRGTPLMDGLDMARQFQLYAVVGRMDGAPPVPRVIYYSDDEAILGAPFYIVERAPGCAFPEYDSPDWLTQPDDAFRAEMCRQYIGAYASLAKLDPIQVLGPVRSPHDECRRWRGFAEIAGNTRLVGAMDRLLKVSPRLSGPPAPIAGDAKLGNILWDNGKIQTVLDWELAVNTEPLAELGYMLYFFESNLHPAALNCDLPGMWRRERVIAEWERVTGRSADGIMWYEAAAGAKIAAIMAHGYHLTQTGQSDDERMAGWLPAVEQWTAMVEHITELVDNTQP